MADKVVIEYEVYDHGIQNSQYFQGWSPPRGYEGGTGEGDNPHEAMEDALEMIAQGGSWYLGPVENDLPHEPSVAEETAPETEPCGTCEGTGEVTLPEEGAEEEETVECPDCDGTGVVFASDDYGDANDNYYYVSVAVKGIDATLDGSWITPQVKQVAEGVLESGSGDEAAVVADYLEEAGATNEELLNALRDESLAWPETERLLKFILGQYAMEGQGGTDYLTSGGMDFNQFVRAAEENMFGVPDADKPDRGWQSWYQTVATDDDKQDYSELYDFIKKAWPYPGTPERAVSDYLAVRA